MASVSRLGKFIQIRNSSQQSETVDTSTTPFTTPFTVQNQSMIRGSQYLFLSPIRQQTMQSISGHQQIDKWDNLSSGSPQDTRANLAQKNIERIEKKELDKPHKIITSVENRVVYMITPWPCYPSGMLQTVRCFNGLEQIDDLLSGSPQPAQKEDDKSRIQRLRESFPLLEPAQKEDDNESFPLLKRIAEQREELLKTKNDCDVLPVNGRLDQWKINEREQFRGVGRLDEMHPTSRSSVIGRWFAPDYKTFYTAPELLDLMNQLSPICSQWYEIGVCLKVRTRDLMSLKGSPEDNMVKLSHVLQKWMDQKATPVTWHTVMNAVSSPIINNQSIHSKIVQFLQEHKSGGSTSGSSSTADLSVFTAKSLTDSTLSDPVSEYQTSAADIDYLTTTVDIDETGEMKDTSFSSPLTDKELKRCSRFISGNLEEFAGYLNIPDESFQTVTKKHKTVTVQAYQLMKEWMAAAVREGGTADRQELIDTLELLEYTEAAKSVRQQQSPISTGAATADMRLSHECYFPTDSQPSKRKNTFGKKSVSKKMKHI